MKIGNKNPLAHQASAYSYHLSSMKQLGVYIPGWDTGPSQGCSPALNLLVPIDIPR